MLTTPRLGLQKPQTSDAVTGLRTAIAANQDILDNAVLYDQGLLAARPVSTPASPGVKGRQYRATDDTTGGTNGTLYYDYGTGWIIVPSLGTGAQQAAAGNDARFPTATEKGYLDSITPYIATLLDDTTAAAARATLGAAGYTSGLYAARPAANTVPAGHIYKATHAGSYISDGTNWVMLAPGYFAFSDTTQRTRTNTAYGTMPTAPDILTGLAMPAVGGKFKVTYRATWQQSATAAARAAIFLGSNQLVVPRDSGPVTEAGAIAGGGGNIDTDTALVSVPWGLASLPSSGASVDATTGQAIAVAPGNAAGTEARWELGGTLNSTLLALAVGGACEIFAAGGTTYDVSVQYKASSGNVLRKNAALVVEVWGV
jgi:hypothetical protein